MDFVKSVIQEKMQVWMNIMIKYFTLPVSTASSLDARNNWNFYAPIQDIFHKNPIHLKKFVYRNLSILASKHHCRLLWQLNMIPCYSNQKMIVDGHVDHSQLWKYWKLYCNLIVLVVSSGVSYDNWHRNFLCMIHISLFVW